MSGDFDADRLIDAMSELLALPVSPDCRQGIALHLRVARTMADSVLAVELPDEAEPAPVFTP